jgi:hypothetical protein
MLKCFNSIQFKYLFSLANQLIESPEDILLIVNVIKYSSLIFISFLLCFSYGRP